MNATKNYPQFKHAILFYVNILDNQTKYLKKTPHVVTIEQKFKAANVVF